MFASLAKPRDLSRAPPAVLHAVVVYSSHSVHAYYPWEHPLTGRVHAVPEAQAPVFVPVGHVSRVGWPLSDPWS